jgi:hypothetical protein
MRSGRDASLQPQPKGVGMASARIISHSPQCWRELAFDLLTRGYTVEIVSPERVPDNAADLELRVGPGGAMADIADRDGARPNSLDFVRQLTAPIASPPPGPARAGGVTRFPERTVRFDAGPRLLGEGWFWRASASFAAVIVVAALVMGFRRGDGASLVQTPGIDMRNLAASVNTSTFTALEQQPTAGPADRGSPITASQARAERARQAASPPAETSQGGSQPENLLRKTDDLRMAAAIINRDKPTAKVGTQNPPQKKRHNEDDVVAPDTVTYIEGAVTAKARVQ